MSAVVAYLLPPIPQEVSRKYVRVQEVPDRRFYEGLAFAIPLSLFLWACVFWLIFSA